MEQTSAPTSRATIIALPGTGMDATFVKAVFDPLAQQSLANLVTAEPQPGRLMLGFHSACEEAIFADRFPETDRQHRIVIAGISIGSIAAVRAALTWPDMVSDLILVMPPWIGNPEKSAAAWSAQATVRLLDTVGLDATITEMRNSCPPWLGKQLEQCWHRLGTGLRSIMAEAITTHAPEIDALTELRARSIVVSVRDDTIHPHDIAQQWCKAIPGAQSHTTTMQELSMSVTSLAPPRLP